MRERLFGHALIEFSELKNEVIELKNANKIYDTRSKNLILKGRDPDDCITQNCMLKEPFFQKLENLLEENL